LIDVNGKPFIFRQLCYLKEQGISQVVLCVSYLGDMIRDLVGSGENFGLQISYSEDGPNLLGTGGALLKAIPLLGDKFFILYGDSFLPVNFFNVQEAYFKHKRQALMTVLKNHNQWDKSNVLYMDGKLLEYNKHAPRPEMTHIDYGLGIVSASVLQKYPFDLPFDLAEVYQDLSFQGQLVGFEVYERFYEIGSYIGLKETKEYFSIKERV
jgi:NDP-sugar pyrophosphorylase family protein